MFLIFLSMVACGQTPKTIGEQIREQRLEKGLNQEELAIMIGMNQHELSLIEDGIATPIEEKIKAIEAILETKFEEEVTN